MKYLVVSFTHKNTEIQTREKIAFSDDLSKENFLNNILKDNNIFEAVLLSTCNRIDIITYVKDEKAQETILKEISNHSKLNQSQLKPEIYVDKRAIEHIFNVASALDSLVIGETQILGQLKSAYKFSIEKGFCFQSISRLMHFAFKVSSEVRNATDIGKNPVSVAGAAVLKAKSLLKENMEKTAVVLGAGEMSQLMIKHLLSHGFFVVLSSRNIKKAQLLAKSFETCQIKVEPYTNIKTLLNSYQMLFTATSAPYAIITQDLVEEVDFERYWFDIAIPRDIEDISKDRLNIYYVDDLKDIVAQNISLREEQAKVAKKIITQMIDKFEEWLNTLEVEPLIKEIYLKSEKIIEKKVQNAIKKGFIQKEAEENCKKLAQTVISELLHTPSSVLRGSANSYDSDILVGMAQKLFGLENSNKMTNKYKCMHSLEKGI